MSATYTRLDIHGDTFEDVYQKMVKTARVSGCKIECDFSGTIINSDMSIDEASLKHYKKPFDVVVAEFEAAKRKIIERAEKFQASKDENTQLYKERGARILDASQLDAWNEKVDLYMQWEQYAPALPLALDMIEMAKQGATTKDLINFVRGLDCSVYAIDCAISAADGFCSEIDGLCLYIQTYRTMLGTPYHLVYPDEQAMASVDEYFRTKEDRLRAIMTSCESIIDEKHMQSLAEVLVSEEKGMRSVNQIEDCLKIVEALNQGMDMDDVQDIFNQQSHDKDSWIIMRDVVRLCDRGEEFQDYVKECERTGPVIGE